MDKEQLAQTLAQTLMNNYFELIKVIDPSVLENNGLLVKYLDILQAKISEEKSKRVEQVQEVEEKLEGQLEQTTEISPVESGIIEAVEEVVEEVEEERKTTFQEDEIDMGYVNKLAENCVRTGQLVTFAPLSQKYLTAIGRRVQELKASKEFTNEQDENIFITPSPNQHHPRPTQTPMAQSATKPSSEEDLKYIEQAARLYLEQGSLPTIGTQPPLFVNEIIARAEEIKKEEKSKLVEKVQKVEEKLEEQLEQTTEISPAVSEIIGAVEEVDMDYVNELAEKCVRTGQLVTLAPLSKKYLTEIGKRVQELKASKESTKEQTVTPTVPPTNEQDKDIFITSSPNQTLPRPTQTPMAQSATKPSSKEDLEYIEQAARMYLELGYLPTIGPQPPLFAKEIIARAKEIEKEERKSTELSDMFEPNHTIAETASSIKK